MGFSTDAIHAGQIPDPTTGAVITPIYQTTTYAHDELGKTKGYHYGRTHNLTREALEKNIASLEKGKYGIAFSSGVAAEHALTGLLKPGDHVIATNNLYGGTYRLYELIMKEYGLEFSWLDTSNLKNVFSAIKPNTKMVFVETPTNPLLTLTDLKKLAVLCKNKGLISVVDNTFATPYFQNPLLFGIDIVVHSTTKYLNGHSDVIGGMIITNNDGINKKLRFTQNAIGAIPSPFDCWLTLRSTKTLAVRMERHNFNAMQIAKYFSGEGENKSKSKNEIKNKIKKVIYPGLQEHPFHSLAKRQMRGFGGMLSLELKDFDIAKRLLNNVKIFTLAESLGGVESLISHPATMSHASVPKEEREKFGITDSLVRLSVGIEDVEDLIEDIENALNV
ncbi:MAG: PLP-dependent aspartate aminotransferase family protein [Ignavibacteriales bacterium]|nr:PLP-dependent aspartate aminotransferase family protein [Ignavibacteriales bacterium]